jgi:galactose mutarotase-like enzyme
MRDIQDPEAWPSGRQLPIVEGRARATVTEVGAGLRELEIDGEPVVWPYPVGEIASAGRGQVLAPWPNRIEDGAYRFGGVSGDVLGAAIELTTTTTAVLLAAFARF